MKKKLWFFLLMLIVSTGLTFCGKEDPINNENDPASKSTGDPNAKKGLPTLILLKVSSVTRVSALVEAQVTDPGVSNEPANKGVCWSITPNPTVNDSKTDDGLICSTCKEFRFVSFLTDLICGATYYVRAYATGDTGTAYSNQLSFTTNPSSGPSIIAAVFTMSLSCTGVIIGFDIQDNGGYLVTKKGVCWATTPNPTIENNIGCNERYSLQINGVIYQNNSWIAGLQPGTTYHARPYFVTGAGPFYGEDIVFATRTVPVVTTDSVTEITGTTAKVHGNITSTGGSFVVERGICWDTVPNLETVKSKGGFGLAKHFIEQEVQSVDGAGKFTVNMTNLTPGTSYYVFTFVGVMTGLDYGDQMIGYGSEITFKTKP